jgi:hypothetical protein
LVYSNHGQRPGNLPINSVLDGGSLFNRVRPERKSARLARCHARPALTQSTALVQQIQARGTRNLWTQACRQAEQRIMRTSLNTGITTSAAKQEFEFV